MKLLGVNFTAVIFKEVHRVKERIYEEMIYAMEMSKKAGVRRFEEKPCKSPQGRRGESEIQD
jgi:hypothetical protein